MGYDPSFPEPVKGIEEVRGFFGMLKGVDMKTKILNMMSKGDAVAAELEVTCTIKRPGEPTARTSEVRFAKFCRVNSKGLLAEEGEYSDTTAKFHTLGVKS